MKCLPAGHCSKLCCNMGIKAKLMALTIVFANGVGAQYPAGSGTAILNAREVLLQARAAKNTGTEILALRDLGVALYESKKYDSSIWYWKLGLNLAISNHHYTEELLNFRPALNNNFFLLGNYTAAMENSVDGLLRAEAINDRERVAHFKGVIGYILMKQTKFEAARRYFTDFLQLVTDLHDQPLKAKGFFYLADLSIAEEKFPDAIAYIHRAMAIFNNAGALTKTDYSERLAFANNMLAEVYGQMNDVPLSLKYSLAAIYIGEQAQVNRFDLAHYYVNGGKAYNRLKQYLRAVLLLRKGLSISKDLIYMECLQNADEQLSIAFAALRNYDSAYAYHLRFTQVRDSIMAENNQRALLEKETRYMLENQQRLQEAALNRQKLWKNISIGMAGISIVIVLLLYNWYSLKQKNRFQAELNTKQQEILRTTIQVADKERKRIAEDLHDTLGSILSATKLKLSAIEETIASPANEKENLREVLGLLDEAMLEMKNIAYNIMPATLSRLGVIAALQSLFNRVGSKSVIRINYTTYGFTERLDEATELSIYQVVLEAMNNIVKHARAKHATVQLVRYTDHINITIEDDGQGFEAGRENMAGNGLSNMQSRVKNHNGTIDIDSQPGMGTTIIIELPYT